MKKVNEYSELNAFELINKVDELPPKLKNEVMATINCAHLISNVGKLFTADMARTAGNTISPDFDTTDDDTDGI